MSNGQYRITLQWDDNPRDLDSHLIGSLTDGSSFHVYFSNKNGVDAQGNIVANLDHDDTHGNGFETVTFKRDMGGGYQSGGEYKYYVHWYSGSGTWGGSNAVVTVYNGSSHIPLRIYVVPDVDRGSEISYWHVFNLSGRGIEDIDELVTTAPQAGSTTASPPTFLTPKPNSEQ